MVDDEGAEFAQMGDYKLLRKLSEGQSTESYLAEQVSVKRQVVLDRLKPELAADEVAVIAFLNDLKVKATIDHPTIGLVFEAVRDGDQVFYTREVLPGTTLEELANNHVQLKPEIWVGVIKKVAEASIHLKDKCVATMPMAPHHVYIDEANRQVRLVNLAVCGPRDRETMSHDKQMLGTMIIDLIKPGYPAATRLNSLCEFMSDLDRPEPLSWNQIHRLCLQVEQQLNEAQSIPIQGQTKKPLNLKLIAGVVGAAAALLFLLLVAKNIFLSQQNASQVEIKDLGQMVKFEKGKYSLPNGGGGRLEEFWIDKHEVTIAEYAFFLEELAQMSNAKQQSFGHELQPESKEDFNPENWVAMHEAAKNGDQWEGLKMTLNCPVVNVTWWDAYAYAKWKGHRLPTVEEFYAVASEGKNINTLVVSAWGEVDHSSNDVTISGVHGLAGNVGEWMGNSTRNPAFPMNQPQPVICGASHANPDLGAKKRIWMESKDHFSKDLGFRTASEESP